MLIMITISSMVMLLMLLFSTLRLCIVGTRFSPFPTEEKYHQILPTPKPKRCTSYDNATAMRRAILAEPISRPSALPRETELTISRLRTSCGLLRIYSFLAPQRGALWKMLRHSRHLNKTPSEYASSNTLLRPST
ncbi:hypothetical protein F4801DRAFT_117334 [Xylaria longipes]|nr:hypothetical protein F4801DRAFT_117334 [Xylaria longipes]